MGLKFANTDDRSLESEKYMLQALELCEKLLFKIDEAGALHPHEDSEIFIQKLKEGMFISQASTRSYCRHLIRRLRTESTGSKFSKHFDDKQLLADVQDCFKIKIADASLLFETFLWLESLGFDLEKLLKEVGCKQLVKYLPDDEDFIHTETSLKSLQDEPKRLVRTWQAVKVELLLCKAVFKCVAGKSAPSAVPLISPLCSVFLLNCLCPLGTNDVASTSKIMDEDVHSLAEEVFKIVSSCDLLQQAVQRSLGTLQKKYKILLLKSFEDFTKRFGYGELRIFLKGVLLLLRQGFDVGQTDSPLDLATRMFETIRQNDGYPPEFVELALEMMSKAERCFPEIIDGVNGQESSLYLKYGQTYDRFFIAHLDEFEFTSSLKTIGMLNRMLETCRRHRLLVEGCKLGKRIASSYMISREALQSILDDSRLQLTEIIQLLKQGLNFLMDAEEESQSMGGIIDPFQDWVCAFLDAKPSLEEFKVLVPLIIDIMRCDGERTRITNFLSRYLRSKLKPKHDGYSPTVRHDEPEGYFNEIVHFVQGVNRYEALDIIECTIFPAHLSVQKQKLVDNALDTFFANLSEQARVDAVYFALQKCQTIAGRDDNGEACRWMLKEVCTRALVTMTADSVVSLFQNCFRMITNCVELLKSEPKFTVEEFNKVTCTMQVVRLVYLKLDFDDITKRLHCLSPDSQNHISKDLIKGLSQFCSAEISSTDVSLAKHCYRTCHSTLCVVFGRTQSKSNLFYKFLINPWNWSVMADSELAYEPKESVIRDFEEAMSEPNNEETADTVSSLSSTGSTIAGSQEAWKLTLSEIEEGDGAKIKPFNVSASSLCNFRIDGDRLDQHDCMYGLIFALLCFEQTRSALKCVEPSQCIEPLKEILRQVQEATRPPLERIFFLKLVINYCKMTKSEETLKNIQHKIFEVFFDRETYRDMNQVEKQGSFVQLKLIASAQRVWFNREELSEMSLGEDERSKCWPFLLHIMRTIKVKPSKSNPHFKLFIQLLLKWRKYASLQDLREYLEKIRGLYQSEEKTSKLIGLQFQKYIYLTENYEDRHSMGKPFRLDHQDLTDIVKDLGVILTTFIVPSQESNAENRKYKSREFLQPASLLCGGWLTLMSAEGKREVESKLEGKVGKFVGSGKIDQLIVFIRSLCERYPKAATWSHGHLRLKSEEDIRVKLPEKLEIKCFQLKYLRGLKEENEAWQLQKEQLQSDAMMVISKSRDVHVNFLRLLNGRGEDPLAEKEERSGALLPTLDHDQLADITRDLLARHDDFCQPSAGERLRVHYFMTLIDILQCCSNPVQGKISVLSDEVFHRLLMSLGDPNEEARNYFLGWYRNKMQGKKPLEILVRMLEDFSGVKGKYVGDIWLRTACHLMLQCCEDAESKLFDTPLCPDVTYEVLDCSSWTATLMSQSEAAGQLRRGLESGMSKSTFTFASSETMEVDDREYLHASSLRYGAREWQTAETLERLQKRRRHGGQTERARPFKERFGSPDINRLRIARMVEQARQRQERAEMSRRLKISLFRRYMHGLVPYIEIQQSDLVRLLQLAASHDDQLCNIVVLEYINVLTNDKKKREGGLEGIEQKLTELIRQVICFPPFQSSIVLSTLLSIGRKFKITIDASSVLNICKSKSECIYDGILSVENSMLQSETQQVKTENKRKHTEPGCAWIPLSELYAMLEERDMEMGIYEKYLSGVSGNSEALKTLNLEVDGRYEEAISQYDKLLSEEGLEESIVIICERGMEESLVKSMKFTLLESWIRNQYDPDDDKSPPFNEAILVPKNWKSLRNFLKCQVGHIFKEFDRFGDMRSSKVSMINALIASARAREGSTSQDEFAYEHALASLLGNPRDSAECEEIVRRGISKYCDSWEHSVTFGEEMKSKRVVELQRLIEFDEYLLSAGDAGQFQSLLSKWSRRQPKSTSRSQDLGWDQILMSRYILLRHAESLNLGSNSSTQELCKEVKMQICLKLAAMAARHDNKDATKAAMQLAPEVNSLEYWCRKVKVAFFKASTDTEKQANDILLGQRKEKYGFFIEKMQSALSSAMEDSDENVRWRLKCLLRQGELYESMGCQDDALRQFQLAIRDSEKLVESGGVELKYIAKAHYYAALFCDRQLKEAEKAKGNEDKGNKRKRKHIDEGEDQAISPVKKYLDMFFESLLSAITNGFEKAKDYLPRFLEVVEKLDDKQRDGIARLFDSKKFAVQPFIQWLPQIIFFHNRFSNDKLSSYLLRELSRLYPQAVYMAFQTEFGATSHSGGEEIFSNVNVDTRTIDEVRKALHLLQDPILQIYDVMKILKKTSAPKPDEERQIADVKEDFQNNQNLSEVRKRLVKVDKIKSFIDTILHKRIQEADLDKVKAYQKEFATPKERRSNVERYENTVKMYSTYLSRFEGKFDNAKGMIIPYQVIGFSNLPSESHCPKLMSFDDRMTFFTSLRRPVRISMRGSDGRDHKWIVKCGEDLRQDERLQQVFGIMNRLMMSDVNCSKKNLNLLTYSVVTLSKSTGIIEFVEGTNTLESFMDSRYGKLVSCRLTLNFTESSSVH
eukprot:754083-Hanusia_phi.AAC.6